jgi:hypothetical protein
VRILSESLQPASTHTVKCSHKSRPLLNKVIASHKLKYPKNSLFSKTQQSGSQIHQLQTHHLRLRPDQSHQRLMYADSQSYTLCSTWIPKLPLLVTPNMCHELVFQAHLAPDELRISSLLTLHDYCRWIQPQWNVRILLHMHTPLISNNGVVRRTYC